MADTLFTRSGVRLRRHSRRAGDLYWLLLPGGPGIGSESLHELLDCLSVAGSIWLVDLPGVGSNRMPPGAADPLFSDWPHIVVEAAAMLPNVVFAGHSTGGMYLLATPGLQGRLVGLALLDTAPDASWHPRFLEMTQRHPLPAADAAAAIFAADKLDVNIAATAVASAEWNFAVAGLAAGRELLSRMPYNNAAIEWSEAHFDHVYEAAWWAQTLPVLVMAGADNRIVSQHGWDQLSFRTPNVVFRSIPGGGHFPWIENPSMVSAAFSELERRVNLLPVKCALPARVVVQAQSRCCCPQRSLAAAAQAAGVRDRQQNQRDKLAVAADADDLAAATHRHSETAVIHGNHAIRLAALIKIIGDDDRFAQRPGGDIGEKCQQRSRQCIDDVQTAVCAERHAVVDAESHGDSPAQAIDGGRLTYRTPAGQQAAMR